MSFLYSAALRRFHSSDTPADLRGLSLRSKHICLHLPLLMLLSDFSVRCSGNPYLLTTGVAYSVVFPCALTVFALSAHWHRRHLFTAARAVIRDCPRIHSLPTLVSRKRHPHSTVGTLRCVCLIHSPLSHCYSLPLFSCNRRYY